MSLTEKGYDEEFMIGLFGKEADAAYDTPITMSAANAFSLNAYNAIGVDWDDTVNNDKDDVTGAQFGTDQELTEKSVKLTVGENKAKPNTVAGLSALVLGSISSLKDSTDDAYTHTITPVALGTALASVTAEHKKGRQQYKYSGIKGNSIKLAAEAGGHMSVEAELFGSGTRTISATAFAAKITESWMAMKNANVWFETGANITIAAFTQGAQNISGATADDFGARIKSCELNYSNNLERQVGFGGGGVAQDIDKGRATASLSFVLNFLNSTSAAEFAYYEDQVVSAFELDLKGGLIDVAAAGVPLYYGIHIRIARGKLMKVPMPEGGPSDILTQNWELDIQDDGTNPAVAITVYNAQADYLAAAV